jgi:glycine betaine/proline transport system substrate-binding protein
MKKILSMLMAVSMLFVMACGKEKQETVKLTYVEWACATATTHVMKAVLEQEGYKVEVTPVSGAAMWQAIATGDQDALLCAWLPGTHKEYYAKVKDKVDNLGPNFNGAKLGLVVPDYVTINSIEEMKDYSEKFDGKIIGIDPGAGIMAAAEKAINENISGLGAFELVEGSDATMAAALSDAIRRKEWVAVTGWSPHWKFARWNLKMLEDPKEIFGAEETINTVTRKGLKEDMPKVYKILDNMHWDASDIGTVMDWNTKEGADPNETAKKWVEENQDKVKEWLK